MKATRILVASDLSEPSDEALRQAYDRARNTGAAIAICHVLPDLSWIQSILPSADPAGPRDGHDGDTLAIEALRQHAAVVIPGGTPEIFVEHGREDAQIVRRAEAWNADLIVVGSRGATGLARLLLGSVAEGVARHAHCDVLVARPAISRGVVIAATDLSDASLPAVVAGAAEAQRRKARLSIVHAVDFSALGLVAAAGNPFGVAPVMPSTETLGLLRASAEQSLRGAIGNLAIEGEAIVLVGPPAPRIAEHATKVGAELLVVGTHGRTGLARMALGSVTARAIRMAPCSVLVVRMTL